MRELSMISRNTTVESFHNYCTLNTGLHFNLYVVRTLLYGRKLYLDQWFHHGNTNNNQYSDNASAVDGYIIMGMFWTL